MSLFLLCKGHLKKLTPRLVFLAHLANLKPLTFVVPRDGVAHLASPGNFQAPLQTILADFGLCIDLSVRREGMPAEFAGMRVVGNERQGRVNGRPTLLCLSLPFDD